VYELNQPACRSASRAAELDLDTGRRAGCSLCAGGAPAYLQPLSKETMMLLGKKGMTSEAPIFVRIFKGRVGA